MGNGSRHNRDITFRGETLGVKYYVRRAKRRLRRAQSLSGCAPRAFSDVCSWRAYANRAGILLK